MKAADAEQILVVAATQINRKWYDEHTEYEYPGDEQMVDSYGNTKWDEVTEALYGSKEFEVAVDGKTHKITLVDNYGGEGQGDEYWFIYKIDDQHFKLSAAWVSWDGVYWDEAEFFEVKAKEVTVTKWVKA